MSMDAVDHRRSGNGRSDVRFLNDTHGYPVKVTVEVPTFGRRKIQFLFVDHCKRTVNVCQDNAADKVGFFCLKI